MSSQDISNIRKRGLWSSRLMFILAAAGSAIGLGNVWKFPYITGMHGGGAFVLMYLGCILFMGFPILMAEILIGRQTRRNPVGAFIQLSGGNRFWKLIGILGVSTGFVILSYYSVIAGWTLHYFTKSVFSGFAGLSPEQITAQFGALVSDPVGQLVWHSIFMGATIAIVIFGVREGLERWIGILMPLLLILLLVLLVYGLVAGDAKAGLSFMFSPDWEKLYTNDLGGYSPRPMIEAMGHAFFTLSLGMGAMITYGSYLSDETSVPKAAAMVAVLDTLIALIAGIGIYTIVFKFDMEPAAGPGLIFKVLPVAFSQMPGGRFISAMFFLLLGFAALTSAISLLEVVVAYFIDEKKWARRKATLLMGGIIYVLGVFSALSNNVLSNFHVLNDKNNQGLNILDSLDLLATNYMLPTGGLFIAIFIGWFVDKKIKQHQVLEGGGPQWIFKTWNFIIRYVTPIGVAVVLLFMIDAHLGIFG